MKISYETFSLLMLIFSKINVKSASYIYQEINETLTSVKQINISLFIKRLTGVMLYAVDSTDRILIEMETVRGETEMVYTFNRHSIARNIRGICGCSDCSNIYMEWRIVLVNKRLSIYCGKITHILDINGSKENASKSKIYTFPLPKSYDKIKNRTFFMIGNIGPFESNTGMNYQPLKSQLTGCLHELFVNGKRIYFNSIGSLFKPFCSTEYKETVCDSHYYKQYMVTYKINDCSTFQLNRRYCATELTQLFEKQETYSKESLLFARMDWFIDPLYTSPCLIEFKMKNGWFITFYASSLHFNMEIIYNDSLRHYRKLKNLTPDSIETMVVQFTGKEVIIQLSSGEDITTYSQEVASETSSIQVGSSLKLKNCNTFQGKMNFQKEIKRINSNSSLLTESFVVNITKNLLQNNGSGFSLKENIGFYALICVSVVLILVLILNVGKLKQIFLQIYESKLTFINNLPSENTNSVGEETDNVDDLEGYSTYSQVKEKSVYFMVSDQDSIRQCS